MEVCIKQKYEWTLLGFSENVVRVDMRNNWSATAIVAIGFDQRVQNNAREMLH